MFALQCTCKFNSKHMLIIIKQSQDRDTWCLWTEFSQAVAHAWTDIGDVRHWGRQVEWRAGCFQRTFQAVASYKWQTVSAVLTIDIRKWIRLSDPLICIYPPGNMLRHIKIDHFISRTGNILTFFSRSESKMGNPLISRTGKIPHWYIGFF